MVSSSTWQAWYRRPSPYLLLKVFSKLFPEEMSLIPTLPSHTHSLPTIWSLPLPCIEALPLRTLLPNVPFERFVLSSPFCLLWKCNASFKTFSFLGFWGISLCWFSSHPRFFFSCVLFGVPIFPPLRTSMSSRILALGFFSLTWDLFQIPC